MGRRTSETSGNLMELSNTFKRKALLYRKRTQEGNCQYKTYTRQERMYLDNGRAELKIQNYQRQRKKDIRSNTVLLENNTRIEGENKKASANLTKINTYLIQGHHNRAWKMHSKIPSQMFQR